MGTINLAMKGVILSGGKGTRLAPITTSYPKQLIPVAGKACLLHCIDYLKQSNITEICIVISKETGYLIREELGRHNLGVDLSYIVQDEPKGLAHAVGITREFTGNDDFVVLLGDNLFDQSLTPLIESFKKTQADSSILLKEVERPYDFGVVKIGADGKAEKLVEKPKEFISKFAIVGVYIFSKEIFKTIDEIPPSNRGEFEITDAIALQVTNGLNVHTEILKSYWFDSGTREGLLDANKRLLIAKKKFDNFSADLRNSLLFGNVAIGKGSVIDNSNIMGPVVIGENVKISNAVIGPYTTISSGAVIHNAELQDSVVMVGSRVLDSTIVSSIIFESVVVDEEALLISGLRV
jgi:glucose-1-phosphate thymidylyltransferase